MSEKEKRRAERAALGDAADAIIREIAEGKWRHLASIQNLPLAQCPEILAAIAERVPGYSREEYEAAIARGAFHNR
jgi:hypothetical protein